MGKFHQHRFDIDMLYNKYQPLMNSIFTKFLNYHDAFGTNADREELKSQIRFEFIKLCNEYDPTRGVDFPGYIKIHLQQRVYHYYVKVNKHIVKEDLIIDIMPDDDQVATDVLNKLETADERTAYQIDYIERISGLDWRALAGSKYRHMVEQILFEHHTLEEIAEIENLPLKTIRLRFYSICDKLREFNTHRNEYEDLRTRRPEVTFDDFLDYKRQVSKIKRTPIKRVPICFEEF